MACDCAELTAKITVDQTAVTVAQAYLAAAQAQLDAAQMQLWIDQYNYMLCGCGSMSFAVPTDPTMAALHASAMKAE